MSWVVDNLGKGSFPQWLGNNVGDNWGRVALDQTMSEDGVAQDWGGVGNSVESVDSLDGVKSLDGVDSLVGDDVGVSEGVGVSESVGGWDNGNLTLLPSRTGKSLLVGNGVGSSGLDHLRGVLNWGGGNKVGNNWHIWVGDWSKGKVVAGNLESTMSSGVLNANLLSVGVDVSIRSTNVSGGIANSSVGLSSVGISVGSLAEFILSVVLGLGGKRSNNLVSDGWDSRVGDSLSLESVSDKPIVQKNLWVGASSGHNSGENDESLHVDD